MGTTCSSEGVLSMVIPALVADQERPGEHREPPWQHEDDGRADVGLRPVAGVTDLHRELSNLPWYQDRSDLAPLQPLDTEQTGGSRLTIHRRQPPPSGPGTGSGGPIVPALQPLVLEKPGRPAAATDAGVLEEAHHGSSLQKLQGRRYRHYKEGYIQITEDWNSRPHGMTPHKAVPC